MNMQNTFLALISSAINASLLLDPESKHRLDQLQNKIVRIELLPLNLNFICEFTEKGMRLKSDIETVAHTTVRGTPIQMLSMAILKKERQQFFAEDLEIIGNAEIGQQVVQLFDELEIDWEEQLSHIIGDIAAHQIGNFARRGLTWFSDTEKTLTQDTADFIHEEINLLPAKLAVADFFNEVDTLRMDVDRIAQKIENLRASLKKDRQNP